MGVVTGVARPTNMLTELSPIFAVHILPLASTAMPAGEFNDPNPVVPVIADDPEKAEIEAVFANHATPLPSNATAVGNVKPPPDTGLELLTVPVFVAKVNAPPTVAPVVEPARTMLPPVLTATAVAPNSEPSLAHSCSTPALDNKQRAPEP